MGADNKKRWQPHWLNHLVYRRVLHGLNRSIRHFCPGLSVAVHKEFTSGYVLLPEVADCSRRHKHVLKMPGLWFGCIGGKSYKVKIFKGEFRFLKMGEVFRRHLRYTPPRQFLHEFVGIFIEVCV